MRVYEGSSGLCQVVCNGAYLFSFSYRLRHLPTNPMSQSPAVATSSANFETIFTAALEAYKEQTKKDITSHPLATQLQSCESPSAILAVLQAQVQAFDRSRNTNEKLTSWLDPTVNVLYAFSAILNSTASLVNRGMSNRPLQPSDVCNRRYFLLRVRFSPGLVSFSK